MKQSENGRSMVEMLGVLAIVGVLSISGIYGYTVAMRNHRANEIIHTASMLVVSAHSANSGEGGCVELSRVGLPTRLGGVDVNMMAELSPDGSVDVKIDVGDDNDALCEAIQRIAASESTAYNIDCGEDVDGCDAEDD